MWGLIHREARSPNERVYRVCSLWGLLGKELVHVTVWPLGGHPHVPTARSLFACLGPGFPCLEEHQHIRMYPSFTLFNFIFRVKTLSPNKVTSWGTGDFNMSFGEDTVQPLTLDVMGMGQHTFRRSNLMDFLKRWIYHLSSVVADYANEPCRSREVGKSETVK